VARSVVRKRLAPLIRSPATLVVAVAYLLFAGRHRASPGTFPGAEHFRAPNGLEDWMYPIDKTNLDVLRFAHFSSRFAVADRPSGAAAIGRSLHSIWPATGDPVRPALPWKSSASAYSCRFAGHFAMVEINEGRPPCRWP